MHRRAAKRIALAKQQLAELGPAERVAFASIVSNTGFRSPDELEITRSTSDVAVCCCSAPRSSCVAQLVEQTGIFDRDDRLMQRSS